MWRFKVWLNRCVHNSVLILINDYPPEMNVKTFCSLKVSCVRLPLSNYCRRMGEDSLATRALFNLFTWRNTSCHAYFPQWFPLCYWVAGVREHIGHVSRSHVGGSNRLLCMFASKISRWNLSTSLRAASPFSHLLHVLLYLLWIFLKLFQHFNLCLQRMGGVFFHREGPSCLFFGGPSQVGTRLLLFQERPCHRWLTKPVSEGLVVIRSKTGQLLAIN